MKKRQSQQFEPERTAPEACGATTPGTARSRVHAVLMWALALFAAVFLPACGENDDVGWGGGGKTSAKAAKNAGEAEPEADAEAGDAEEDSASGAKTSAKGRAEFRKGVAAYEEKEYEDALIAFKKSAEKGCTDAEVMIGLCYKKGRGLKRDSTKAKIVIEDAAEAGNASALVICALELLQYDPRDKVGIKLIRRAAEQDCAFAQVLLGMYYNANGNLSKGLAYLKQAAGQSLTDEKTPLDFADNENLDLELDLGKNATHTNVCIVFAQATLGSIYADGRVVRQDLPEARKWLKKTMKNGLSESELEIFLDRSGLDLYDIFDTVGEEDDD